MNLSKSMKKRFVEEIRLTIKNMKNEEDPAKKLYFFSAVYGMAQRIINLEYEPELNFILVLLQCVYNTIDGRLTAMMSGRERAISLPDNLFNKLEDALQEMSDSIEQGENTYPALQKMANLAYSTTGNGYYLYLKGALKI